MLPTFHEELTEIIFTHITKTNFTDNNSICNESNDAAFHIQQLISKKLTETFDLETNEHLMAKHPISSAHQAEHRNNK